MEYILELLTVWGNLSMQLGPVCGQELWGPCISSFESQSKATWWHLFLKVSHTYEGGGQWFCLGISITDETLWTKTSWGGRGILPFLFVFEGSQGRNSTRAGGRSHRGVQCCLLAVSHGLLSLLSSSFFFLMVSQLLTFEIYLATLVTFLPTY